MKVQMRPIDSIRPYEHNPRRNDAAVAAVAASIEQFGFRQPIVVDADGVIIVGHTRWKAAKRLGLASVPVHVAADLTPQQARAYRLADNRTAETADWDPDLLPIELGELNGEGVDLSGLGFSDKELAEFLRQFDTDLEGGTPAAGTPGSAHTVRCPKCGHEFPVSAPAGERHG